MEEGQSGYGPRQLEKPGLYDHQESDRAAASFAKEIGADVTLCIKAAHIASNPLSWEAAAASHNLTVIEKEALRSEGTRGFFSQRKALQVTLITLCLSAVVQGWVQAVTNGANITMPKGFDFKPRNHDRTQEPSIWLFATFNSITNLTAAFAGYCLSEPLRSRLGQRGTIFASTCLCIVANTVIACVNNSGITMTGSDTWLKLIVARSILGVGLGCCTSAAALFNAEILPHHLRGEMAITWQTFNALGTFCGFGANLILSWTGGLAWRFQLASATIPAMVLLALIWTTPESPRWLLRKNRGKEAFEALCVLRQTPLQATIELFVATAQIQRETDFIRTRTADSWAPISQLFRDKRTRQAAVAVTVIMAGQQLCGVNVLMFYSTYILQKFHIPNPQDTKPLWINCGIGFANLFFTHLVSWWMDRYGRRFLLLCTYPGMIVSLLGACLSFFIDDGSHRALLGVFLVLFILFYSLGQGSVGFAYSAEIFPPYGRDAGMRLGTFVNLFGAGLLALFLPIGPSLGPESNYIQGSVQDLNYDSAHGAWRGGQGRLLGIFVALCTVSMILIFLLVPETRTPETRTPQLEELNYIFGVENRNPVRSYINHIAKHMVNSKFPHLHIRGKSTPADRFMYDWTGGQRLVNKDERTTRQRFSKSEYETPFPSDHEPDRTNADAPESIQSDTTIQDKAAASTAFTPTLGPHWRTHGASTAFNIQEWDPDITQPHDSVHHAPESDTWSYEPSEEEVWFMGSSKETLRSKALSERIEPTTLMFIDQLADSIVEACLSPKADEVLRSRGQGGAASTSSASKSSSSATARKGIISRRKRQRSSQGQDEGEGDSSNRDRDSVPPGTKRMRKESSEPKLLACPYSKHDPSRYSQGNSTEKAYRRCASCFLTDIPRLKQHLYRTHKQPDYCCPRCQETFKSSALLADHTRQEIRCECRPPEWPEKMSEDQYKSIRQRTVNGDPVELWYKIYHILFPSDVPPPSPYVSGLDPTELDHFTSLFRVLGPEVFLNQMRSHREQISGGHAAPLDVSLQEIIAEAFALAFPSYLEGRAWLTLLLSSRSRASERSRIDVGLMLRDQHLSRGTPSSHFSVPVAPSNAQAGAANSISRLESQGGAFSQGPAAARDPMYPAVSSNSVELGRFNAPWFSEGLPYEEELQNHTPMHPAIRHERALFPGFPAYDVEYGTGPEFCFDPSQVSDAFDSFDPLQDC